MIETQKHPKTADRCATWQYFQGCFNKHVTLPGLTPWAIILSPLRGTSYRVRVNAPCAKSFSQCLDGIDIGFRPKSREAAKE